MIHVMALRIQVATSRKSDDMLLAMSISIVLQA